MCFFFFFFSVVAKHFNFNTKCKASSSQEMWQKTHVKDSKENLGGFFFVFLFFLFFFCTHRNSVINK